MAADYSGLIMISATKSSGVTLSRMGLLRRGPESAISLTRLGARRCGIQHKKPRVGPDFTNKYFFSPSKHPTMSVHDDGLLFVYGECGPDVTEEEFNGIFSSCTFEFMIDFVCRVVRQRAHPVPAEARRILISSPVQDDRRKGTFLVGDLQRLQPRSPAVPCIQSAHSDPKG